MCYNNGVIKERGVVSMKCSQCCYHWQGEGEIYPRCHCDSTVHDPPCEWEEEYEEDIYDD